MTDSNEKMSTMNALTPNGPLTADRPTINARSLIGEGQTCHIVLDEQVYTLRITRAGKLILTK